MAREPLIGTDPEASEAMRRMLDEAHRLERAGRLAVQALEKRAEDLGKNLYETIILVYGDLDHEEVRACRDDMMKAVTELREAVATREARSEMRDMILAQVTSIPDAQDRDG